MSFIKKIVTFLIILPEQIAAYLQWAPSLFARIVVGYVFMLTGYSKLQNLPQMIENFREWGIPYPEIMTPFVSGVECFGGLFLILGLLTRISGGALAVVMIVATISAKLGDVDSLETLFGFEETAYLVIFFWLAVAGAGKISLDRLLLRKI